MIDNFARYEFKYLLRSDKAELIENEVRNFMLYDKFVDTLKNKQYPVRSLYFDNDVHSNFYEKTDGLKSRAKFRLRTYSTNENKKTPVFFEIKGKYNERTYKKRLKIDRTHLNLFMEQNRLFDLQNYYPNVEHVEKFVFDSLRRRLKPYIIVDYKRRPYISDHDTNFRLTFDSELQASKNAVLNAKKHHFKACVSGHTVLELKFHRRVPIWFHRLIQTYDLRRVSISKFVTAMKTCELATDLS